jgi:hypothetical protein
MEMEGERPNASNDTVVVPRGGGGGSRGLRNETVVSSVDGGDYANVYPWDDQNEKMEKWPHGADVRVNLKDGKPDVLCLKPAENHQGHTLRKKSRGGQRPHFSIPTASFGKINGTVAGRVVESWPEGDTICVRIASFYKGGQA